MQDSSKGGHNKHVLVSGHAEPVRRFLRDLVVDSPACTVVPSAVHDVVDVLVRTRTASFAVLHSLSTHAPVLSGFVKHELGGGWVLPERATTLLETTLLVAKAAYVPGVRKRKHEVSMSEAGEMCIGAPVAVALGLWRCLNAARLCCMQAPISPMFTRTPSGHRTRASCALATTTLHCPCAVDCASRYTHGRMAAWCYHSS